MENLLVKLLAYFWRLLIFGSVAWYAFLIVYVGYKGGLEILLMIRRFDARPDEEPPKNV